MRLRAAVVVVCAGCAIGAACGGGGGASTQVIHGTEILTNTGISTANTPCNGDYGAATFEDLGTGSVVGVQDQNGSLIGNSLLKAGTSSTAQGGECIWKFNVKVPTIATSYSIIVGTRVPVTFTKSNLVSSKWSPVLTVDGTGG